MYIYTHKLTYNLIDISYDLTKVYLIMSQNVQIV